MKIHSFEYTLEPGIAHRAAIGLISLATDSSIEYEWRLMFRNLEGASFFHAPIQNDPIITEEALRATLERLAAAAAIIRPGARLDSMAFGCTSAAMLLGHASVARKIQKGRPGVPCTSPMLAAITALQLLKASRIALLTPYRNSINFKMCRCLEQHGISVEISGTFNNDNDNHVCLIDASSIRDALLRLRALADVDAIFVSCTSLRVLQILDEVEQVLGIPLLSSNQVLIWHALRLAGYDEPVHGFGKLARLSLSLGQRGD